MIVNLEACGKNKNENEPIFSYLGYAFLGVLFTFNLRL